MPSANDGKKKGNIRFPYRLCEGEHLLHLCPLMDKASKVLEKLVAPQPQLLIGYQRLSSDPLPVSKEIDLNSSLVNPTLLEHDYLVSILDQPLVGRSVDLALPLVAHSVPKESGDHITYVLLVSSDSHESKSDPPIPIVQESPSSIPARNVGSHMIPPPSSLLSLSIWVY